MFVVVSVLAALVSLTACGGGRGQTGDGQDAIGQMGEGYSMEKEHSMEDSVTDTANGSVTDKSESKPDSVQEPETTENKAEMAQEVTGGDLFFIETVEKYPATYRGTTDQAKTEQNNDARPELSSHVENMDAYDTIILIFPKWSNVLSVYCVHSV